VNEACQSLAGAGDAGTPAGIADGGGSRLALEVDDQPGRSSRRLGVGQHLQGRFAGQLGLAKIVRVITPWGTGPLDTRTQAQRSIESCWSHRSL